MLQNTGRPTSNPEFGFKYCLYWVSWIAYIALLLMENILNIISENAILKTLSYTCFFCAKLTLLNKVDL